MTWYSLSLAILIRLWILYDIYIDCLQVLKLLMMHLPSPMLLASMSHTTHLQLVSRPCLPSQATQLPSTVAIVSAAAALPFSTSVEDQFSWSNLQEIGHLPYLQDIFFCLQLSAGSPSTWYLEVYLLQAEGSCSLFGSICHSEAYVMLFFKPWFLIFFPPGSFLLGFGSWIFILNKHPM